MTEDTIASIVAEPGTEVIWDDNCYWYVIRQTYQVDGVTFGKSRAADWYDRQTTIPLVKRVRDE
jgi:hypothetical protein